MKKVALTLVVIFNVLAAIAQNPYSDVSVRTYIRANGTIVNSHYRTAPNFTKMDIYSTYPNVNSYTGVVVTRRASSNWSSNTFSTYTNNLNLNNTSLYSRPIRSIRIR